MDNLLHLHHSHTHEAKADEAIKASQDPNNPVTAEDAEKKIMNDAHAAGAPTFAFDPNASAEEKKALAASHRPEGLPHIRKDKPTVLVSDMDATGKPDYDLPEPSTAGALASPTTTAYSDYDRATANGQIDPHDPKWEKTGWAPRFGNPGDHDEEPNMLDHQTWVEGKIPENMFGDWYHNAAVIVFACLSSWVVAVLGGGLGWVIIIMCFCGTYYRTSMRRVRRNFRDDINRQLAKNRLETDTESLEWMNTFLVKFWPIYAPVLCDSIIMSVDQVLSTSKPAFLDSLRLKTFTLGTKPPRMEFVKSYPKAEDDIIIMDWKFSFTPNDVADLTSRQITNKVNPKVVLEIRLGKGMVSKGLDIIVEDMACTGLMRVKLKLQLPFPHIEKAEICFLGKPSFDYKCKPLGGDTFGFDINFIPGLEHFIQEQIHANLGPMMYDPNVFPIEVAKMLAGNAVDEAIGVLQIVFHGAQGLKNPDKFSGTPDPYATVSINHREVLGKTKTVHQSANPRWNETVNVIITSLSDSLTINVYDWNEYRKDKDLGLATFALEQFEKETEFENQSLEVTANGRPRGVVQADLRFFPVLQGAKSPEGGVEPPPESSAGIVKFTVEQAKELDGTKSMIGQLNPYAVLMLNGKEVHVSKKLKRTNNPVFNDATKELLITDRKNAKLGLVIKDDREMSTDLVIGSYNIRLTDMMEMMDKGREWYNLMEAKTGRVKLLMTWKPVGLTGALSAGGYVTPIGVMRLHFISARHLRNVETMGKSDPYVRVLLSGVEKGRTVTFKNNLNPDWDEVIYVPVHSARERLILEVMDAETVGKDRSLGLLELAVADYLHQGATGEFDEDERKTVREEMLKSGGRGPGKGNLNFTASFYPTWSVFDPEEEEREEAKHSLEMSRASMDSTGASINGTASRKRAGTVGSMVSAHSRKESGMSRTSTQNGEVPQTPTAEEKPEIPMLHITPENLTEYESGLIVFKLVEGDFAFNHQNCYVEVVIDDMLFPSYSSARIKSQHVNFNDIGDAMVRELDFSKITLRLTAHADNKGENKEQRVRAKLTGQTLDVLRRALYTPTTLTLKDAEGHESKVTVSLKYIPVKMHLDPSESINNQGNLRVEVLDAADLPAADRNGFSDPYCKFYLDGKDVHKTEVQKKTLHPAWNEFFETTVRSRTGCKFEVQVYDWDQVGEDDFLGKTEINLNVLEPFNQQEVVLGLDGKSGTIRLKMLFKPDYVTRSRQGSSTFRGTFAVPGKVVGAPVKGVGKGAVLVGGGVAKGASFLGKSFRRKTSSRHNTDASSLGDESSLHEEAMSGLSANGVPATPPSGSRGPSMSSRPATMIIDPAEGSAAVAGGAVGGAGLGGLNPSSRARSFGSTAPGDRSNEHGTATITLSGVSGFKASKELQARIFLLSGGKTKEVHKTEKVKAPSGSAEFAGSDTVVVPCAPDAQFKLVVLEPHTFGADHTFGDAIFFADDQGSGGAPKDVKVGEGSVKLHAVWKEADANLKSPTTPKSKGLGTIRKTPRNSPAPIPSPNTATASPGTAT